MFGKNLKKAGGEIKIALAAVTFLALFSQIIDPPVIYVPGFVLPVFGLVSAFFPLGMESEPTSSLEMVSMVASIILTVAVISYSAWRMTKNAGVGILWAGFAGALLNGVPHLAVLVVLNIIAYIPQFPQLYNELGALCILAVPLFLVIQAIPLLIDMACGFALGAAFGFLGTLLRKKV